jgi:hypothetical protein
MGAGYQMIAQIGSRIAEVLIRKGFVKQFDTFEFPDVRGRKYCLSGLKRG